MIGYSQLTSLTITNCKQSRNNLTELMALTPGLVHLKVVSYKLKIDFLFSGSYWEELITRRLPLLKTFELCCVCRFSYYDHAIIVNLKSLIESFREPFWMTKHRWFVTCDYIPMRSEIRLYTTPVCMTNFDEDSTRVQVSSIDNVYCIKISPRRESLFATEIKVYVCRYFPRKCIR